MKRQLKKNWWYLAINGLVAIIVGLIAIFLPKESLTILIQWLGAIVLIGGLGLIGYDILNARKNLKWGLWAAQGGFFTALGVLFLAAPHFVVSVIFIVFGIWAILAGLLHIITILAIRDVFKNYIMSLINGVLMIVIGVLLIARPINTAVTVTTFIGAYLLIYGVWQIYMALRIRKELSSWQDPEVIE